MRETQSTVLIYSQGDTRLEDWFQEELTSLSGYVGGGEGRGGHERDPIYSVDIQPGRHKIRRLVSGGVDKFVRVCRGREGEGRGGEVGHERDPIYSVDIQPGRHKIRRLVSGGIDKFVRVCRGRGGEGRGA